MNFPNDFAQFVQSHMQLDAYSDEGANAKAQFKRVGTRYFKALAQRMDLPESEVYFNHGGMAGSGDFHFKGMFREGQGFDLFFNLNIMPWITYRATTGLKDCHGDRNRQLPFAVLFNPEQIIEALTALAA